MKLNFGKLQMQLFSLITCFMYTIGYGYSQSSDYFTPPGLINGVYVTKTSTGSVSSYSSSYTSCGISLPANSEYIGQSGPFTYTLHFEKAVNEVTLVIAATGNSLDEHFMFTTNSETPSVSSSNSCYSRIENNQVYSGANSVSEGGGGAFTIKTRKPFTTMTISGEGGQNGTLLAFKGSKTEEKTACAIADLIPQLTETSITGNCSDKIANLSTITALNLPSGVSLSWHSEAEARLTNKFYDNDVLNGTYYAAFYDRRNNCFSKTKELNISVSLAPKVYAGPDIVVCEGDSVYLKASGAVRYSWDKGIKQGVYFTPKKTDVYTVTGTSENGCKASSKLNVILNPKPKVSAGSELFIAAGDKITLAAEGASTYRWNYSLFQGASFVPDPSRTYIVTGIDQFNCSDTDTLKLHIELKKEIKLEDIPLENFSSSYFKPVNVVFLLDISTSMIKHEKFELLKYSVVELLNFLRPEDRISLVSFASDADVILPLSNGNQKELIKAEVNKLTVSGKSAGTKGIKRGFKLAEKNYIDGGTNMVIILTDGAINQEDDDYLKIIADYQKQNIYFSVVGIKNFPKDEERMREAALAGKGAYVPIFSFDDAKKNLILEIKERAFKAQ